MQTNTPSLPEWSLPIRDAMKQSILSMDVEQVIDSYAVGLSGDDLSEWEAEQIATTALAEALPMVAEHFAAKVDGFHEALIKQGTETTKYRAAREGHIDACRNIATAIRREVGQASKEPRS